MRPTVRGLENFPKRGPAIVVINHLGDADAVLILAKLPFTIEAMGKIELNDHWFVGPVFRAYGVIWVHRGRPDRRAIRAALEGLVEGRMVALAPEGRQSLIGGLEEGNEGAAFLALKSGASVVPVALTGTENQNIYPNLKKWKRTTVTLTVGTPFVLFPRESSTEASAEVLPKNRDALQKGTRQVMESLASLLPEAYRGKYRSIP
jgi:1-acyl-sn-glycerol-3-phosphate acyltransferase